MGDQIPSVSKKIEATNLVVWKDRSIRARIDPTLAIKDVLRQFSLSFDTDESYITLAIRDENDKLVTDHNLAEKIQNHEKLQLVPSPTLEALDTVAVLRHALNPSEQVTFPTATGKSTLTPLKMALFNLSKYIIEEDFAIEFVMQNGVDMLDRLIEEESLLVGNSLAYALNGLNAIMDLEQGWNSLSDGAIGRLLKLINNASLASNIARPSTLILQKLVDADPKARKGKARDLGHADDGPLPVYGFKKVHNLMKSASIDILPTVAQRLEAGDLELLSASLGLINALLAGALSTDDDRSEMLLQQVEMLHVRRTVARLVPSNIATVLTEPLFDFQHLYLRILQHRMQSRVEPWWKAEHETMLSEVWKAAKLESHGAEGRSRRGWAALGLGLFEQEGGEGAMFDEVGELGLECLHHYTTHEDDVGRVVLEQAARPEDRRCPIGAASSDCVKLLVAHYTKVDAQSTPILRQHFLNFVKLHALATRFFIRMWQESAAHNADYERLVKLTGSHIRGALANEHKKSWLEVELDFLETDYRTVRERQMVELEQEDDLFNGPGMNTLKQKLRTEALDFMTEQRINCMLLGGWFYSGALVRQGLTTSRPAHQNKPWRFLRLMPSRAVIAWADYPTREATPPTTAMLSEKVELDNVTSLLPHTCANVTARHGLPSPNSFSIMADAKSSLLDVVCIHAEQYAEWVDGFKMLRQEMSSSTKETANYVNILSDLALKVRLLDMSGEGVRAPGVIPYNAAPSSTNFYFASS